MSAADKDNVAGQGSNTADPMTVRALKRLLDLAGHRPQPENRMGATLDLAADPGRPNHVWRDWLAHERASLSAEEYSSACALLDQLAASELAAFRSAAKQERPVNQIICASTMGATMVGPDTGLDALQLARHEPALLRMPRIFGHALTLRDEPGRVVMEEGLVRLHAIGSAPWYASFMAHRAAARGWGTLWVAGAPSFRRQLISEARSLGLEAASHLVDL